MNITEAFKAVKEGKKVRCGLNPVYFIENSPSGAGFFDKYFESDPKTIFTISCKDHHFSFDEALSEWEVAEKGYKQRTTEIKSLDEALCLIREEQAKYDKNLLSVYLRAERLLSRDEFFGIVRCERLDNQG